MEPVRRLARLLGFLLATVAPAAGETGVFRQFPLPSPNSGPTSVLYSGIGILFTEYDGNKVGFLTRDGRLIEYPIPTLGSGPMDLDLACDGIGNCYAWFTEFLANKIGRLNPHTGEFQEFQIPTIASGPHSIVAGFYQGEIWFTEFYGNKIGRLTSDGRFTEFEVPTPDSGPMGITRDYSPDAIWFTEFNANKLGRMPLAGGSITELTIPTPSSGPTDIRLVDYNLLFTEFLGNKIGKLSSDRQTIAETEMPTASSGPFRICKSFFGNPESWFTEWLAGKVAVVRANGAITEYEIDGSVDPFGCSFAGDKTWFTQKVGNTLGWVHHDTLMVPGAGGFGGWETSFLYSNPEQTRTVLYAGYYREPIYVCGLCPWQGYADLSPHGTGAVDVRTGPSLIYSRSVDRGALPMLTARATYSIDPKRSTTLPVARLSTVSKLNSTVLVFPGAVRTGSARSNLFFADALASTLREDPLFARIDVFTSDGELLASEAHSPGGFLVDILDRLGIPELRNAQIRVTRSEGDGLLWGALTTVDGNSVVTDLGRNLSVADETVPGGDPLVVLGGAVGDWDTEFDVGNARAETLNGTIQILSCTIGATCPVPPVSFSVLPNGTATLRARAFSAFPEGLHTYLVRFEGTGTAPTLRARVVNRARPSQTAVLPALHRSAIRKLEQVPLSFPGGAHSAAGARSNLVLGEAGRDDATALVQVFDPSGNLLKAVPVLVPQGRTLMLPDVVGGAGTDLENAHVLVTRTGGGGTLWGMLATIDGHEALSIGWGVHP